MWCNRDSCPSILPKTCPRMSRPRGHVPQLCNSKRIYISIKTQFSHFCAERWSHKYKSLSLRNGHCSLRSLYIYSYLRPSIYMKIRTAWDLQSVWTCSEFRSVFLLKFTNTAGIAETDALERNYTYRHIHLFFCLILLDNFANKIPIFIPHSNVWDVECSLE